MNNRSNMGLIGIAISLIIVSIFLPLGVNIIYQNPIQKSEITSLSTADKTSTLLNGTDAGLWNSSILEPSFTNYTDIIVNTTVTYTTNFTIQFSVSCDNVSAIDVYKCDVLLGGLATYPFNASNMFNTNFTFATTFSNNAMLDEITYVKLRMYTHVTSNVTIGFTGRLIQYYTDSDTDTLNSLYYIIPLIAVISVIMMVVSKSKSS